LFQIVSNVLQNISQAGKSCVFIISKIDPLNEEEVAN